LDEALAEEPPPSGVAPEILAELEEREEAESEKSDFDLFSLWSAMIALTHEVKLQGRAFQKLHDTVAPWIEKGDRVFQAQQEALGEARRLAEQAFQDRNLRESQSARDAERRVQREMILLLLDLRDRLGRQAEAARDHRGRAERVLTDNRVVRALMRKKTATTRELLDATKALEKGLLLSLGRIDETLDRLDVREVDCRGRSFDPHAMRVMDVGETSVSREGEVLEVYRPGYEWNGEVVRHADVKVARSSSHPPEEEIT
jgi:molecular chaperone GrpE